MIDYFNKLRQSFTDAYHTPALFLPLLAQVLVTIILSVLLLAGGALILFSAAGINALATTQSFIWTSHLIILAVLLTIVALFLLLVVNAWFLAGFYGMIDAVVAGKKLRASTFFAATKRFYLPVLGFSLIKSLLFFAAALPFLVTLIAFLANLEAPSVLLLVFSVIFALLFILATIFIGVGLLFAVPAIIRDKLSAWRGMRESFSLLRRNPAHVLLTLLTVILCAVAFGLVAMIVALPTVPLLATGVFGIMSIVLLSILRLALQFFLAIVILIFLFRAYPQTVPVKAAKKPTKRTGKTLKNSPVKKRASKQKK